MFNLDDHRHKFRTEGGVYVTKSIFFEMENEADHPYAVYTLKDRDHEYNGNFYPSLKRLFIEEADLTEYSFARKYLENWTHWKRIKAQGWFRPHYEEWVEELKVAIQSAALANIVEKAGAKDYHASKYLLEQGWMEKEEKITGPRTKEKIRREAQKLVEDKDGIMSDYKRILGNAQENAKS